MSDAVRSYDEALLRWTFDVRQTRAPVNKRSLGFRAGLRGSSLGHRGVHSRGGDAPSSEYFPRLPAPGLFP
jgi:hypothetical protein